MEHDRHSERAKAPLATAAARRPREAITSMSLEPETPRIRHQIDI